MNFIVYILECKKNRYYTGYTTDLEQRYQRHVLGTGGCKFTRAFPPIRIAASWPFEEKTQALKMEYAIKQLTREQKAKLVAGEIPLPTI